MCMKGTSEGCILLERVAKVEAKQNVILGTVVLMFLVLAFMAIKLLNTQIFLLTGDSGLRTVTDASKEDAQTLKQISGGCRERGLLPQNPNKEDGPRGL